MRKYTSLIPVLIPLLGLLQNEWHYRNPLPPTAAPGAAIYAVYNLALDAPELIPVRHVAGAE